MTEQEAFVLPTPAGTDPSSLRLYILRRIVPEDRGYSSPCWIWLREKDRKGYARTGHCRLGRLRVHRTSYEAFVGPIPDGLQIDHLCCVTSCVNPSHLERVTAEENVRRMCRRNGFAIGNSSAKRPGSGRGGHQRFNTHCSNGHEYTPENTLVTSGGTRKCRACRLKASRKKTRRISMERAAARQILRGEGCNGQRPGSHKDAIARCHNGAVTL